MLDAELDEVQVETLDRISKGLDVEDQEARAANLREARDRLN